MCRSNIALMHSYDMVSNSDKSPMPSPGAITIDPFGEAGELSEPTVPKIGDRGISDVRKKKIQGRSIRKKICV